MNIIFGKKYLIKVITSIVQKVEILFNPPDSGQDIILSRLIMNQCATINFKINLLKDQHENSFVKFINVLTNFLLTSPVQNQVYPP